MSVNIHVNFQHWHYQISGELLTRYGSPFFSRPDKGFALRADMLGAAHLLVEHDLHFDPRHIICANEAFPEAALADPLGDLQVWDEWESGYRVFPYPGRFSRLGITQQDGKISSPSSVGVLGEIFAGLFSQAYIGPQVLVRVIRHWPDFIFSVGDNIYAFIESKAFTGAIEASALQERMPDAVTRDFLCDAVEQLNADPHLEVWAAFTGVVSVNPRMSLTVTFVQISPPREKRERNPRKVLPEPVIKGVAERAVSQAASKLDGNDLEAFYHPPSRRKGASGNSIKKATTKPRAGAEERLARIAQNEVEAVFRRSDEPVPSISRADIKHEIEKLVSSHQFRERHTGKRFFAVKESSHSSTLQKIRQAAAEWLYMANIPGNELNQIDRVWRKDWRNVTRCISQVQDCPVWRFGGAVYCCGPDQLEGSAVSFP